MYRVATYPNSEKRWHIMHGATYPGAVSERFATPAEARIMDQILREDASGRMPDPELGVAIRKLMSEPVSQTEATSRYGESHNGTNSTA